MTPLTQKPSAHRTGSLEAMLMANPLFRGLDKEIVNQLAPRALTRQLKKGTKVFRKGDPGSCFYAVLRGAVRISAPSSKGSDAVLNLLIPGEIFGEIAVLDGGVRSADAVAVEDSELLVIERRELVPVLRQHPDLAMRVIEVVCARLRRTSEQVEDVMSLDVTTRLAKAILLLDQKAQGAGGGHRLHITQRELSQMIGASRESTNKQLREWERKKVLSLERARVDVLQRSFLEQLLQLT